MTAAAPPAGTIAGGALPRSAWCWAAFEGFRNPAVVLITTSRNASAAKLRRSVPRRMGVSAPLTTSTAAGSTSPGLATGSDAPSVTTTLARAAPLVSDRVSHSGPLPVGVADALSGSDGLVLTW